MMASFGWRQPGSVQEWLEAEPWEFEFFQAVKLLEAMRPGSAQLAEGSEPELEYVHLHSRVSLEYPASEVQHLEPADRPDQPPKLTVNLLGLAGMSGPLPNPDTELILERVWRKDTAMRDFLDIFNHRLLSLLVKIRKAHRLSYTTQSPDRGHFAGFLYCCFGLGLAGLRDRLQIPDRALLYYSGILAQQPRSASGIEQFFSDFFRVKARVRQMVGFWRPLDDDQWTRVGESGQNQLLGRSAVLGSRYWDQQGQFEINLGPLDLPKFIDLLPIGTGFHALCELTRFYCGPDFVFTFRLTLRAPEVPESTLLGQTWLGWTSWLKTRPFKADDSQVTLRARDTVA